MQLFLHLNSVQYDLIQIELVNLLKKITYNLSYNYKLSLMSLKEKKKNKNAVNIIEEKK